MARVFNFQQIQYKSIQSGSGETSHGFQCIEITEVSIERQISSVAESNLLLPEKHDFTIKLT